MYSSTIVFKSSLIHYTYSDGKKNPILCFHGYGESEYSFHFLEKYLSPNYCLIAIDMPYHGKTEWKEKMQFEPADLLAIVQTVLDQRGFSGFPVSLLAFSMGGRVALSLFELLPRQVKKIVLLAPDGLKINFWYWLATQTWPGNKLFAATIRNPQWFLWFLKLGNTTGLLNKSVFKFVEYFLHDSSKRKQLYLRWTCLRKLKPNLSFIKDSIQELAIPCVLIYGQHDRIIIPSRGIKFRIGIEKYCDIEILESGHQVLQEKNAAAIIKHFPKE